MHRKNINSIDEELFSKAFTIYEVSFPWEERRDLEQQTGIMSNKQYHFDILIKDNKCVGILLWWLIDNCRYIEHFAIDPDIRNSGLGRMAINAFVLESSVPIILELETPNDTITRRRVGFYKAQGFLYNDIKYEQPSFHDDNIFVDLRLMSYPNGLNNIDVKRFKDIIYRLSYTTK